MARARYCAFVYDYEEKDEFIYTFYCFAPAFFLARNPTHAEKVEFANQLATRYNPRVLNMKSFGCYQCGNLAHEHLQWLTYALRDPGCLAVNNSIIPVCEARDCLRKAKMGLAILQKDPPPHRPRGPEMLSCRVCFKDCEQVPLQACSRCNATLYCSRECQKMGWKSHKQQCTGRFEAAQLTTKELAQLDLLMNLKSGGTMELPHLNHAGKLPEAQTKAGLKEMLQSGREAASARHALVNKLGKQEKKNKAHDVSEPAEILVTPEQKLELEGIRADIFQYFGVLK